MTVSSAYRFRRSPAGKAFRAGCDAAMEVGGQRLGDYALDKAIKGFARPVYDRDGKLHHVDTRHDGRLLMFMLERLDRVRFGCAWYEHRHAASTAGDRFADALDTLAAAEAAEAAALDAAAAGAGSETGGFGEADTRPAPAAPHSVAPAPPPSAASGSAAAAPALPPRGTGGRWAKAAKTPPTP